MLLQHMIRTAALLGLFAIVGTGLVALTFEKTKAPIADSQRNALLNSLHQLIPETLHDNDIYNDFIIVNDPLLGAKQSHRVFRARKDSQPVAIVLEAVAPDGYKGNIFLLIAINNQGTLLGVRVVSHTETPGLGDPIEIERSDWITKFNGRSLKQPDTSGWQVKKDGGDFDQFTGATITPRAIVKAVHKSLQYFQANQEILFSRQVKENTDVK